MWGKSKNWISETQCLCGLEIPRVYSYSKEYGRIHKDAAQEAAGREDAEISRLCMSLNELQKKILHVIGTEGLSKSVHIIAWMMQEGKWSDSTCRRAEVSLVRMGILKSVVCRGVPHMLKVQLYHMTKKGKTIFEGMYGKKPVESEMETLILNSSLNSH